MSAKPLALGGLVVVLVIGAQSPPDLLRLGACVAPLVLIGVVLHAALRALTRPRVRGPMIASGFVTALVIALPAIPYVRESSSLIQVLCFPGFVLAALIFGVSYLAPDGRHPYVDLALVVMTVGVYWLINTAILGTVVAALRRRRMARGQHTA